MAQAMIKRVTRAEHGSPGDDCEQKSGIIHYRQEKLRSLGLKEVNDDRL